nr:PREDICTED: venom factor [Anolis carolinensis]|eukprot:XP_016846274.1 PREDICTED: venom factor [Anolis carolinensis]
MIVPSVLWVESEQRIVVEAHGLSVPTEVTISVHNFPQKRNSLYQIKAAMNPANDMMVTPLIKVPAKDLNKDSKKNQYVIVQATCPQFTLEKVVLVSFQSGYILTQTDKTIYKPGSSVRYRVFSIGHAMERLDKNVIIEFETPEGVIVSQNTLNPASTLTQSFNLPETVSLGTWNVVTKYEDSPQKTFRTPFDVKEYGSDMVVAERGGINIVTSPYQIHFTKTPKFFKPGMPYKLMVFVTNPDGSPAARVPVVSEPIRAQATTQKDGTANLVLNTPADTQELKITWLS